MILLKTALLVGLQGAVVPKMSLTYMPLKNVYLSQSLAFDANGKYPNDLGQLNLEAGMGLGNWAVAVGHEAVMRDIKSVRHFDFVEISYKKEF